MFLHAAHFINPDLLHLQFDRLRSVGKQTSFTFANTDLDRINFDANQAYLIISSKIGADSWWCIRE